MFCAEFKVSDYSLDETLPSGQAFRWQNIERSWEGVVANRWVRLTALDHGIKAESLHDPEGWSWLVDYLQLDIDYEEILASFPKDEHMPTAVACCRGLRLLKQDPWECLASFILSSTKQIVQIRQIVDALCRCHGELLPSPPGAEWYSFPSVHRIASLSESELRSCKMGFRAPYLKRSAEMIMAGKVNLESLRTMALAEAREELIRLPGVGCKIADCVLLFAYGFPAAFPIDVWIMKALHKLYFPRRKPSPERLRRFLEKEQHFGPHSGYAQQFLFHYIRTKAKLEL